MALPTIKITFLGTGTSMGIPIIGCKCPVCQSTHKLDKRLRTAIALETQGTTLVIDTGPDFRQQMLKNNINTLNAVLFTHQHIDHTAGLDDLRAFNLWQKAPIPVYATTQVQQALKQQFNYIFAEEKYPGTASLILNTIQNNHPFKVNDISITPIEVIHGKLPILGFRIGNFTYITDASYIAPSEIEKIKGSEVLVINALRIQPHWSHFNLEQALEIVNQIKPQQTYFTHLSHFIGLHQQVNASLPPNVQLAYDELIITL